MFLSNNKSIHYGTYLQIGITNIFALPNYFYCNRNLVQEHSAFQYYKNNCATTALHPPVYILITINPPLTIPSQTTSELSNQIRPMHSMDPHTLITAKATLARGSSQVYPFLHHLTNNQPNSFK